jgi:cytochrome P450
MYMLTKYPDEMRKLQEEIDSQYSPNPAELIQPDFESIQKLEYLDMFVKEVLRFYPIANGLF